MAHYLSLQVVANANEGMKELSVKLSLALLRHTDIIPADKAFYLAGMACNVRLAIYVFSLLFIQKELNLSLPLAVCRALDGRTLDLCA